MATLLYLISPKGFQDVEYEDSKEVVLNADHMVLVAAPSSPCIGKYGKTVTPDLLTKDITSLDFYDGIVAIGGPGTPLLADDPHAVRIVREAYNRGKLVSAICMAPALLLTKAGIMKAKQATCFQTPDGSSKQMLVDAGASFVENDVVIDGNVITANGPDAAKKFGEAIITYLAEHKKKVV